MSYTKWVSFLLVFLCIHTMNAQDNLTGYWQPQVAINYDVAPLYSHNFSVTNRNYVLNDSEVQLNVRQLDVAHFSNLKIQDNQSIALGVQYRFRNAFEGRGDELRFTQQYNFTKKPMTIRFGHRFRAEQRITKSPTIHRFRYRFTMDFPLKGETLNMGEAYFVGNLENLLSVSKMASPEYDVRLTGQIGWQLQGGLKLQTGLEYRLEDFSSGVPQNVVFLLTSAQISL